METEKILSEYSPGSFSGNSPKTPLRNSGSDFDFNDVFGGPPRRFSMPEVRLRYSFSEMEEDEERVAAPPWGGLKKNPVFGEENVTRRRHRGDDFFDDIFRGDGPDGSPRRTNRDRDNLLGSRIMSPDRSLPPKPQPFHSSRPAQFSQYKMDNNNANGSSSPGSSLSRFSNQATVGQDEIKNEVQKDINIQRNSKKDRKSSVDSKGNNFHFSIYKWAAKGVPMIMPLMNRSKNASRLNKSASSNGRIESHELSTEDLKVECERKEYSRTKQETQGLQYSIEKAASGFFESISRHNNIANDVVAFEGVRQNTIEKSANSEKKLLRELLNEADEKPTEIKENKTFSPKKDVAAIEPDEGNVEKTGLKCADVDSVVTPGKNIALEKMTDFAQIFNKETHSRPKDDVRNEVNEILSKDKAQQCNVTNTTACKSTKFSTNLRTPNSSESPRWDSKVSVEILDDHFEDNFQVQELSDDLDIVTEEMKALDAKIRQWSAGKEGNIRSLLSTLQYVLWPGSGWKPIPLVDLIEANSVKRAYQKALLRLHPDKLQQKDAASHQTYIAQKVFDLLQEAWDHFNTLAPL